MIVQTYDQLQLPAKIVEGGETTLLFINGSTPYDEVGNIGPAVLPDGTIIKQPHDFCHRFVDIMSAKGYDVATMAKRSFAYPQAIPRPSLDDLASDVVSFIKALDLDDLVIVGYSEGSTVASKVLGMLEEQPRAVVLLGSASLAFDYDNQTWEEWFMTDIIRKQKGWTDEQLETEYEQRSQIRRDLRGMDEETFETEYKNSRPFGFGFASWESFNITTEIPVYDPTENLLQADIPILICVGSEDNAMPVSVARRTYEQLQGKADFKVIPDETHQYNKYDVFALIDTWIQTGNTDIVLDEQDRAMIDRYTEMAHVRAGISALSWDADALDLYQLARQVEYETPADWFKLGLVLFNTGHLEESLFSFEQASDPDFLIYYAPLVWRGHIYDMMGKREEALSFYNQGLAQYPGFPAQHDQWGMLLDKAWIQDKLENPYTGIK